MTTSPRFAEIRVDGPDAHTFLHSQLANDIRAIEPLHWRFGSYCVADGRVQALMMVACETRDLWRLLLPADLATAVAQRLQRYRLRARCAIDAVEVGIAGDDGGAATPAAHYRCGQFCWQVSAGPGGPLDASLAAQQVRLGIPWLVAATSERFLPQMLALERLQAYSLRKGCFPGQEIVARTHYLGRSKRRLARLAVIAADSSGEAGSELCGVDDDHVVGVLVGAAAEGAGALAVLPESAVAGMSLRIAGTARSATFVIEGDVIETIGDTELNGIYHPHSAHGVPLDKMV